MCLIALAWQQHPGYPLILVANRDEFYARPTAPADWWANAPGLLGGRDLQAGGTWLAAGHDGRWAAVTNYREGHRAAGDRSRGELVPRFVSGDDEPLAFVAGLDAEAGDYGGFNLLVGDAETLAYCSNRGADPQLLSPGTYTLSNHLLDTPWPKAELARLKLQKLLRAEEIAVADLLAVLADRQPFDDHSLPVTGIGKELEKVLSPPFIAADGYGTRCTTVLLVGGDRQVLFAEQNFEQGEKSGALRLFQFRADGR